MEIMKKNKITKIILYSGLSCIIAIIIFLTISYFGKEESVQKKDSSQSKNKQEQVENNKDNNHDEGNNQSTEIKEEQKSENKDSESNNKVIQNKEKISDNVSQKNNRVQDYKGKKLSESEGVGTTGKIFNSQKEALDFGKQEVKKLTEGDKKPRQFSISKVTTKDGSLVGWTVDIFEGNSVEKIVSNPTENNRSKEQEEESEKIAQYKSIK